MLSLAYLLQRAPGLIALFLALLLSGAMLLAWADLDRMERLALSRHGPDTAQVVGLWRAMLRDISTLDEREKIERVNAYFNTLARWRQDIDVWQQHDYWATPLELMAKREGDCEDFSIAKYMTLLLSGVEVGKMRITYVKARLGGVDGTVTQAHMVLAYYPTPNADPLILDNMISEVRPASRRDDLKPVFGFNSEGIWVGGASKPSIHNPAARLSRWRDLLQRMAADGLG
jgi:predicted transglutaminase-like cysteine proteinase|tara:strand:- start:4627 stop:5316 length:690 start_codon:yes stop_codon:yes gene_type:complete